MSSVDLLGCALILIGGLLLLFGIVLVLVGRLPFLDRVPGDLVIRRDGVTIFFPIVTMIVVSVLGTVLLNLMIRIFNR